jgi:transposase-like protein
VTHWTNRYLNNHLEQDHRCVKQSYRSIGGLKTFATATHFCCIFGDLGAFLRPQSHRNQSLTLEQRWGIHKERLAELMGLMAAA